MSRATKIPGTFKNRPSLPRRDLSVSGAKAEALLTAAGALVAQRWVIGDCTVMCAREPTSIGHRWHVSVAHPSRYPTWDEIKTAIYGIGTIALEPSRSFAQLLGDPAHGDWLNVHDNCFHLYEIDTP